VRAEIGETIKYRNLIKQLIVRDLKLRYARSFLGFLWSLLNPLIMILIYTFFFSRVVRIGIHDYPVFLVTVLLPWNFISRALLSVAARVYENGEILNHMAFPSESLVIAGMLSYFVDFCLEMLVLLAILCIFQMPPFPGLLALPFVMALHLLFTSGIAFFFSVLYVFYRDTQYLLNILTTVWLYLTPVFYPATLVPAQYQFMYNLNPMVHIAGLFRTTLYEGKIPGGMELLLVTLIACTTCLLGWAYFNTYKRALPEII